jgi:nitrogen fixation/metabolism regulation signal transduction histidine kinase
VVLNVLKNAEEAIEGAGYIEIETILETKTVYLRNNGESLTA